MDQDGIWHGDGLSPDYIVLDEHSAPPTQKGGRDFQFSAHFYCGQTAGCITMSLDMEAGLGPGHIVLDGDPAPPKRGHIPNFRLMSIVAKRLYVSGCQLVRR